MKKSLFTVAGKSLTFAWNTNRKLFLLIIFLNLFIGSTVYVQYTSFASIVDEIVKIKEGANNMTPLIKSAIMLGLSFLIPTIASNILAYSRVVFRMQQSLHLEMYKIEKQSNLDIGTIESNSYQTLLRGAKEWGSSSVLNLQDFVFTSASSFAGIATSMVILGSLNKWLVLFAFMAAAPVYFFYKKYSKEVFRVRYLSIDDQRIIGNRISHFEELQKAVDVILLQLKYWLKEQIFERKNSYNKKIAEAEKKKWLSYGLLSVWYLVFLFAAIALMTREALAGTIAVGGLLLAFNTYTRFYQTINSYVESISFTEEAARYASKWFELFELKPKIISNKDALRFTFNQAPLIEFKNVSFRYPNEDGARPYVLQNLSFTIKPGEKIAIVGVNGAGKTTLIKLLCRVYDPTDGSILINGTNLRDINLHDWHEALGILFQDFPVYNSTILESIGIGRVSVDINQIKVKEAAVFSGADEFINNYNQLIWKDFKDGVDLSKGQHQRLAVARMFYRNAPVTILDEPTASIDAVTEEKIFASLEQNMEGRSVVLITHRFSTVKNADTILVLEHGKIIEQGMHQELIKREGRYAELYNMQAKRYLEDMQKHVLQPGLSE
ncbi:ABC transporter ATP-binding protein [Chryseosolibacter indicus]|uniref:ABC transporter ATP-binding protein/permease n=1 Tax=Chryseosolibacter indicus TaxID=2782351 RepID=A0ABS5VQH4_9BACT|nr:ABC transporter ATP-binding protein [Chryseosolibacter indicus]MBT1703690.1 ABC transporter ATP-binding protein/permease [Chryseosolibacter indicus]